MDKNINSQKEKNEQMRFGESKSKRPINMNSWSTLLGVREMQIKSQRYITVMMIYHLMAMPVAKVKSGSSSC